MYNKKSRICLHLSRENGHDPGQPCTVVRLIAFRLFSSTSTTMYRKSYSEIPLPPRPQGEYEGRVFNFRTTYMCNSIIRMQKFKKWKIRRGGKKKYRPRFFWGVGGWGGVEGDWKEKERKKKQRYSDIETSLNWRIISKK